MKTLKMKYEHEVERSSNIIVEIEEDCISN